MSTQPLACTLALPAHFRASDILHFHDRDAQGVAERVHAEGLQKGLSWQGQAACLSIRFDSGQAHAELAVDGRCAAAGGAALQRLAARMLGLTQPVDAFEAAHGGHPQLGPLITSQRGLRVPLAATPFEALSWAVTGQQISVHAAVALRRKLILATGLRHSGGLACYPDAALVAALGSPALRAAGFSQSKADTLLTLAHMAASGALPLDDWLQAMPPADVIARQLLAIRGIGPWTVSYALLRGFGWLDGSLHGDAAVRRGLQALLQAESLTAREAERWLAAFSPWRALVAAHLWAFNARRGAGADG